MINDIPASWKYAPSLENLFFFFQSSEELLSHSSPDSFRLPVCNCMTLCFELQRINGFLYDNNQIDRYYSKYIPCIIDELIKNIAADIILKPILGLRLDSVIAGLTIAKCNPKELLKWINIIKQSCTLKKHTDMCKKNIIQNVNDGNNKSILLWLIKNYYIDLIATGYSTEYLYQSLIKSFDNRDMPITSPAVISTFLNRFDNSQCNYEFFVIADTYKLDNLSRINPQFGKNLDIQELDKAKIIELKRNNGCLRKFHSCFEELKKRGDPNIKMLSCKSEDLDPYSAFGGVSRVFDLAQCFEGYFKHRTERKIFFDILLVCDSTYVPIKIRRIIPNRPHLEQSIIDKRIDTMLSSDFSPIDVVLALVRAMDMHLDAINCKNTETMLRSFWTALEALFFVSDDSKQRESAKYCLLHIIQKTYILKQLRVMYEQLLLAITDSDFWAKMGIEGFAQFVDVFMSSQVDESGFKQFTEMLSQNPLLRSRIYWFRQNVSDCKNIRKKIKDHCEKVSWQIDRIYRTRNLSTHAGISMPYTDEILFNIHNYFDYAVNYIICKLENKDYIPSVSAMLFEAKNDNQIHINFLEKNPLITKENYLHALFGPDLSIISYNFEAIVTDESQV